MAWWAWLLDAAGVLLVLVLLYGAALVVRRRVVSRHGGTFELSYRARGAKPGRGWVLGLGRYSGEELEWFRVFSLTPRAGHTWKRRAVSFTDSRAAVGTEQLSLYPGHVVVRCRDAGSPLELAMSPASLTGFQAWLESSPPGTDWSQ